MSKWPMVKLGKVLKQSKKIKFAQNPLEEKLISVQLYGKGAIQRITSPEKAPRPFNGFIGREGQIVYSRIWARKGAIAKINQDLDGVVVTNEFPLFDVLPTANVDYLIQAFQSPQFKSKLEMAGSGTSGQNRIKETAFLALEVPLPPLGEQKRIAEILGRVNYAIQSLDSQIQFIESLPNKIFEFFFNEEHRRGKRPSSTIANFISNTQYGISKKAAESGAIPILRMGNITYSGQIDRSELKYIDLTDKEIDKYTLQDGDLLFNRTNSVELVGKTAVFEENLDQKVSYAGYLIRARTNADSNPYYVSGYLNSPGGKAQLRLRAKSIVGMANINATEFLSLRVPAATKSEQDDFAHFYLECKSSRKLLSQKLALLQELQRSLSARAFAGLL